MKKMLAVLSVVALVDVGTSSGRPHLDFGELLSSSDVVVVAELNPAKVVAENDRLEFQGRSLPAQRYRAVARTIRVVKGDISDTFDLEYQTTTWIQSFRSPGVGVRLLFLKRVADKWDIASHFYPDFPALVSGCQQANSASTALDRLNCELAATLASPDSGRQKQELLSYDYALPKGREQIDALRQGIATATDPSLKRALQAQLLFIGDISQLKDVCDVLLSGTLASREKSRFAYVIGTWLKNVNATPQIRRLLNSKDQELRSAATQALWHSSDRAAVPDLARMLDDTDRDIRYYAVRGLGDITGQDEWNPSVAEFEAHSEKYLAHWREWAAANLKRNDTAAKP